MEYLSRRCFLVCIVLTILFSHRPAIGQDESFIEEFTRMVNAIDPQFDSTRWKLYSSGVNAGLWYYDRKSIVRNKKSVSVWTMFFPNPEKTAAHSNLYSDHEKIYKVVFVTELACKENKFRQPLISLYDVEGNRLAEIRNGEKPEWDYIEPESTLDSLRGRVCAAKTKQRQ